MHRLLIIAAALLCLTSASPAVAQRTWGMREAPKEDASVRAVERKDLVRTGVLPPQALPVEHKTTPAAFGAPDASYTAAPGDSLSETEILQRISRIYGYQAEILKAQAEGNNDQAERMLELAMTEISTLMQHPGVMERPRFPEMYRSLVSEYENYYGVQSDSLNPQYGDIFQLRADMFASLNDIQHPLLEDVMLPKVNSQLTTVQLTMNRLVEQSIAYLLRTPEKHLYLWMARSETYFPMVEQILKEEGVPDEIKYLAMIESGLNPYAQSWAQAVGMWQFISGTGRMYGLEINSWVDERRDPEKATRAAARHLRDLYRTFGDWHLAMAAYNCGAGNVTKALRRAGNPKASFWEIWEYLPKETRGYVPMYIAAALVASNPHAFNVPPVRPGPRYEYHHVPVQGSLSLTTIAELAGTDVEKIRALNPELRRNSLPPSKSAYMLRLPIGTYDRFADAYAGLPEDARNATEQEHTVRRGETLTKIARQYGVSTSDLAEANDLKTSARVRPGQELVIPVPERTTSSRSDRQLAQGNASTVQYGERTVNPLSAGRNVDIAAVRNRTRPANTPATPVVNARDDSPAERTSRQAVEEEEERTESRSTESSTRVVYKVRRGDSLGKIASKYDVTINDLKEWNNLRSTRVRSGQTLRIYPSDNDRNVATASTRSSNSSSSKVVYKVRRGDSLGKIADKYNVTVSQLKSWNNLRSNSIHAGQRLTIQGKSSERVSSSSTSSRAKAASSRTKTYRVRRGDNLSSIASRHGMTLSQLKKMNNLRSSTVRVGQKLKVRS